MLPAPIPANEIVRVAKLRSYLVLDTLPEESFDRLTRLAADVLDMPIVLISLIDSDRQWFKSKVGIDASESARDVSFCGHAIMGDVLFEIEDATKDKRFCDNPFLTEGFGLRFYAGAPLKTPDGLNIGTLCAIDRRPRKLNPRERRLLEDLASIAVDEIELRSAAVRSLLNASDEATERALHNDFVSTITHELRTPLTSILGSLRLLADGRFGKIEGQASELLTIAKRNSETLARLVNDLLDFQKLGADRMEYAFTTVDAAALLHETCENMRGMAATSAVEIDVEHDGSALFIADGARIAQVLTNLLSNAIRFSKAGHRVKARLDLSRERIRYCVSDTGPGISPDFRTKVFEKFSRAAGQPQSPGTGLGLAISKLIVEAHGGTIWFDSSADGTTFFVELPRRRSLS